MTIENLKLLNLNSTFLKKKKAKKTNPNSHGTYIGKSSENMVEPSLALITAR